MKPGAPPFASLQTLVQSFFEKHLVVERHASRHTVMAYRDSLKLFLAFAAEQAGCSADQLDHDVLDVDVVKSFWIG